MPVELPTPAEPIVLTHAKVVAFKVEDNAEHWMKIWVSYGRLVDGIWLEHHDPTSGDAVTPTEYHIEVGHHPLAHGTSLRQCPTCDAWYQLETVCTVEDCGADTNPYDGYSRLVAVEPVGDSIYKVIRAALYEFLTTEQVPDLVTWEVRVLLATVEP